MKTSLLRFCAALVVLAGAQQFAHAQVISDAYVERGLRFGGAKSFEGEPYTQRYSYGSTQSFFFLNGDSRQLSYMDYLDRADRAQKFGYRMPIDPFFPEGAIEGEPVEAPIVHEPPVRVHIGGGFGWFRRR